MPVPLRLRRAAPMLLFVCVIAWICVTVQFGGHNWGDDFALYINQARGLANGTVAQVVADTRYAVDNSGSATFSPYVYPWGFPIMLVPVYVAFGMNYAAFKFLGVLSFCAFVVAYHTLVRARTSNWCAWTLTVLVGLSPPYLLWTDSVTSDLPALGFVFIALVWIDRCRRLGRFDGSRPHDLVLLGLLIGWALSIRREGVALFAALLTAQLLYVISVRRTRGSDGARQPIPWRALATPWCAALGLAALLQLVLPSSLVYDIPNGGWSQLEPNAIWYRDIVADHLGLHQAGATTLDLFGSHGAGTAAFSVFIALVIVGVVRQMVRQRAQDAPLLAVLIGLMLIVGRQPFHEGRYMFTIAPLLIYFAVQAVPAIASAIHRLVSRSTESAKESRQRGPLGLQMSSVATFVLLAPLIQSNWNTLSASISYHQDYDYIQDGPESPNAQAMFSAVRRCTRGDDVVLFARARAMNLYTSRRSIQTSGTEEGMNRSDWMVLSNSDVDYYEPPIGEQNAAELGLGRVWHNDEFSLYIVHSDRPDGHGPCPLETSVK